MKRLWLAVISAALLAGQSAALAQGEAPNPAEPGASATIAEKISGARKLPGFFNLYWDAKQGKLWLEIDKWGTEFLYQSSLPAGVGSNDIGLDRGQLGRTHVVRFERSGPRGCWNFMPATRSTQAWARCWTPSWARPGRRRAERATPPKLRAW